MNGKQLSGNGIRDLLGKFRGWEPLMIRAIRAMFLTGVMLAPGVSAWSHEAEPSRAVSTRAVVQAAENETARFNAWLDAKYEEQLDFSPMSRGYAGRKIVKSRPASRRTASPAALER